MLLTNGQRLLASFCTDWKGKLGPAHIYLYISVCTRLSARGVAQDARAALQV